MPADHILFGSDFPAASPLLTGQGLAAFGISAEKLQAINRDNALGLMLSLKT
jgi:predicted TIM-barrel fold metal-dependent hydrolase